MNKYFDEFPFLGELRKALKTRNQLKKNNKLYELQDWEVVRMDFLPAKEFVITVIATAVFFSSIFKYIINIHEAEYDRSLLGEVIDLTQTLLEFIQPFAVYLIGTAVAKSFFSSQNQSEENVRKVRAAYFYQYGQYCFYFLIIYLISNILFDAAGFGLYFGIIPHQVEDKINAIGYLLPALILKAISTFFLVKYNFFMIPNELKKISGSKNFSKLSYATTYILNSIKYTLYILIFIILVVGIAFVSRQLFSAFADAINLPT